MKAMRCFSFSSASYSSHGERNKLETQTTSAAKSHSSPASISNNSQDRQHFMLLPASRNNNLIQFTLADLKSATRNFSRSLIIGEGGFGCVYRAKLHGLVTTDDKMDAAVKQLGTRGLQGHKEWITEVNVLGFVNHPNLVKLIGYCAEDDERGIQRLLVYEYMPNKSLQDHLSTTHTPIIPWSTRLRIAQDAARGLAYLHEEMEFQIIFRDFKSSNILLDDKWNAKLSDFGLARLGPLEGLSHVSTAVVGTVGYAAPEYIQTGRLTYKSDVWSYGVFLYELITGRRPLDLNRPKHEQKLLDWVRPHISTDLTKFQLILDPRLRGDYSLKSAQKLAAVANKCLLKQPRMRPRMSQVLDMVKQIVEADMVISPERPFKIAKDDDDDDDGCVRRLVDPVINGDNKWLLCLT